MKEPSAVKIKTIRRQILTTLNIVCPTALTIRTIYYNVISAVDPTYDEGLCKKDIWYLKEKGYIEFVDDMIGGTSEFIHRVITLTARGKEIAEKTQFDPALEI